MKNLKSLIIIGILSFVGLTSCFFEEENIFDDSSAKRMNITLSEYFDLLTSSPNGWVLNYFPTDDQIGYTLLMNFDKNNSVRIAAKNKLTSNQYKDSVSLFRMIADNGPVLTFDSFNPLLHVFSNPENPDGRGMEGDYEFIVMKTSPDKIILKGKKRGVYMDLTRLPEDQNWVDYFKQLDDMNNLLFNKNVPRILLSVNNSLYTLDNGISHIFLAVPKGGDPITENEKIPFIVTDKGILFSKVVNLNNSKIREFHLSEDKNELLCVDEGENAKIIGNELPIVCFHNAIDNRNLRWTIKNGENTMSPLVRSAYDKVVESFKNKKLTLGEISYMHSEKYKSNAVYIAASTGTSGYLGMDKEATSEGAKFTYRTNLDNNGLAFYNNYGGVAELIAIMSGSFKIETQISTLNPSIVKMTNLADPNVWFLLDLK